MKLGQIIQEKRKKAGLTQKELAEKVGVATITIQQYERNAREPKLETIKKIANVLGASQYELLRPVMERDDDFVNSEWFAEMSDEDIFDAMLPSPDEAQRETKKIIRQKELLDSINLDFLVLNEDGQEEAAKRIQELTEIPKYRCQLSEALAQNVPDGTVSKEPSDK